MAQRFTKNQTASDLSVGFPAEAFRFRVSSMIVVPTHPQPRGGLKNYGAARCTAYSGPAPLFKIFKCKGKSGGPARDLRGDTWHGGRFFG